MEQTYRNMNPEYYVGYHPLTGPIVDPPASAAARQGELNQLWCLFPLQELLLSFRVIGDYETVPLTITTTMLHRGDSEACPRYICQLASAREDSEASSA